MSSRGAPPLPDPSPAASHEKVRPSPWWFTLGAALVVTSVAIAALTLVSTLRAFTAVDATIEPGESAQVRVSGDPGRRMLWGDPGLPPRCEVLDVRGEPVVRTAPGATYTKSVDGREWRGLATLDDGAGRFEVTCAATGGPLQVGPAPSFGAFLGGIAATIAVPLVLGGSGLVVLVVTAILFATRRARSRPSGPDGQEPRTT